VSRKGYLKRLSYIYEAMDKAYREGMAFYGLDCSGCEDNCCRTYFFHYTLAEYFYLLEGFSNLDAGRQREIAQRAEAMSDLRRKEDYICPLNVSGRCLLYPYRAMICRLHGLPFVVHRPDGFREEGPGCPKLEKERALKDLPCRRIDRTPFYTDLADLERQIRTELRYFQRFKKTIAEMIRDGGKEGVGDKDEGLIYCGSKERQTP
jgi:hypothetical protein